MRMRALMRRRVERSERGMSIVEVSITVGILGLVLTVVYGSFMSATDTVAGTNDRLRNLDEARTLVAVTAKDVRTAVRLQAGTSPFVVADDEEATFYANLNTTEAPKLVHIYIDGSDRLIEEVWEADAGTEAPNYTYTGTAKVRLVGRYVSNTAADPVFTYYDTNGNVLTNTPLSATDRLAIKQVGITLHVRKNSAFSDEATTVTNRVRLPNLDYNAVAG